MSNMTKAMFQEMRSTGCDIYVRCLAAGATVWLRNFLPMKFKDMDTFSASESAYMLAKVSVSLFDHGEKTKCTIYTVCYTLR